MTGAIGLQVVRPMNQQNFKQGENTSSAKLNSNHNSDISSKSTYLGKSHNLAVVVPSNDIVYNALAVIILFAGLFASFFGSCKCGKK